MKFGIEIEIQKRAADIRGLCYFFAGILIGVMYFVDQSWIRLLMVFACIALFVISGWAKSQSRT